MNPTQDTSQSRILIVDDNVAIHDDIRKILCREEKHSALEQTKALLFGDEPAVSDGPGFDIESAYQGQEGLRKVAEAEAAGRPFALAFVDVRMPPGWDGVETIVRIWEKFPQLQIVICTAYSDYSWEEMIRRIGKSDSLVILKKPFDNIEVLQLAHALTEKWRLGNELACRLKNLDYLVNERTAELQSANGRLRKEIEERTVLEGALRLSEERFSKAFKASPIPLAIQSLAQEKYVDTNEGFEQLTGYSRGELIGQTPADLDIWVDPTEGHAIVCSIQKRCSVRNRLCELRTKSKQLRQILLSAEFFDLSGELFLLTIAQDISEQVALESQLRQAQKMEAVGQLAAGVAHDLNNRLAVIEGYACLLLEEKAPESSDRKSLDEILAAAEKASKLIKQLLAFSRKQVIEMRPMTLTETFAGLADILPRVLSENNHIKVQVPRKDVWIMADPGMVEQMLMNCAVNARDAMPDGGWLTLSSEVVEISPDHSRANQDAKPGQYMRLSLSDTGSGIPPEILSKIFEPFFTTKPVGKGTGLGLATVYGTAKQHGGWVEVESQPGKGSTFHIFIPTCAAPPKEGHTPLRSEPFKSGRKSIPTAEGADNLRACAVDALN